MAYNVFRTTNQTTLTVSQLRYILSRPKLAYFSSARKLMANNSRSWFKRFLTPTEEKNLYFDITRSFREKLVEQSEKSHQSYSNIIEHALLASTNNKAATQKLIPAQRLKDLPAELDTAGKEKDVTKLQLLEQELLPDSGFYQQQLITLYNRLIRAYLWSDQLQRAETVLAKIQGQDLLPTTRTFTYFIKAYLEAGQLSKAKNLVDRMQQLSLLNLKRYHSFDFEVMLRHYIACGDNHAIEYLWRDMAPLIDTINPTLAVFTTYMDYLLHCGDKISDSLHESAVETIYRTTQTCLHRHQKIDALKAEAFVIWLKAAELLVKQEETKYTQQAEHLLFYLIKRMPSTSAGLEKVDNTSYAMTRDLIRRILQLYITDKQDLKILAFYYNLQKTMAETVVLEQLLDLKTIQVVEDTLRRVEKKFKHEKSTSRQQMSTMLEGLILNV